MNAFDLQHPGATGTSALQRPFRFSLLAVIVASSLAHNATVLMPQRPAHPLPAITRL